MHSNQGFRYAASAGRDVMNFDRIEQDFRFKSQIVIDNPGGLNHLDFNNTRPASPFDAHPGGFFCLESKMKT